MPKSDIEIARETPLKPINQIAEMVGIREKYLEPYGKYKAKISLDIFKELNGRGSGKLIMVTAINPTPAGEGKTTTSIGLSMGFWRLGYRSIVTLREPSLGPCMGIKGGATGGGYSQVLPMEDINLHFTGDFHAVSSAHNLLSAMVDNAIYRKNRLDIWKVYWPRTVDMNDRALRFITVGLRGQGVPREDYFVITSASEVMAILGLSRSYAELKERLANILVGIKRDGTPVFARDVNAHGAMSALLRDALKPNLVQTTENTPALVHIGPFANIAHGTNSIIATKLALKLADYVVTETGFGSDLGAEKFFNVVCRIADFAPNAVVIVASIRALKMHGGLKKDALSEENLEALEKGFANLKRHISIVKGFGVEPVVAINRFPTDTDKEIELLQELVRREGVEFAISEAWAKGGEGAKRLAEKVKAVADSNPNPKINYTYDPDEPMEEKIRKIAIKVYGAKDVVFEKEAQRDIRRWKKAGFDSLYIIFAKTQYSLSDDPTLLGAPEGFTIKVREVRIASGAGFIIPVAGEIMTMPGLPKKPAAESIYIDDEGNIWGLF